MEEEKLMRALYLLADCIERLSNGQKLTRDMFIQLNEALEII